MRFRLAIIMFLVLLVVPFIALPLVGAEGTHSGTWTHPGGTSTVIIYSVVQDGRQQDVMLTVCETSGSAVTIEADGLVVGIVGIGTCRTMSVVVTNGIRIGMFQGIQVVSAGTYSISTSVALPGKAH
jgi:hypothetical protein